MRIDFAPLESMTDDIYRRIHHAHFPGADRYFIPFVTPTQHRCFTPKEKKALSPLSNQGISAIPQVLTRDADLFLWAAGEMGEMGYGEVNLNLGCPAPTVTGKGRGSGMLRDPDALKKFLDDIFEKAPLPLSLKTRIGFSELSEWPALMKIFSAYPWKEVILHFRLREEFYGGIAHRELLPEALSAFPMPVIYNGDVFTVKDGLALAENHPSLHGIMLGRGFIANPALAREMKGGEPLNAAELRAFHDELAETYVAAYDPTTALYRMKALMHYMACCFESPEKARKALHKAANLPAYLRAADQLFALPLCSAPAFYPDHTATKWR